MPEKTSKNYKVFLTIWAGQLISTLGSGLTNFGIGVWIFQQTHSATAFGMAALFTALPGVIMSPIAGSLVDRWDRRVAMMVSAAGSGLASLGLAILVLGGRIQLWEIYALMGLSSAFSTLTFPAISAITSTLVEDKHLGRANGLLQFNEAASMILAPILAASVMAIGKSHGLQYLITLDVIRFVVAIFALLLARTPVLDVSTDKKHGSVLAGAMDGWRFIVSRPGLLGMLLFFLFLNFTLGVVTVLFTPLILTYFDVRALGVIQTASGTGMLLGTVALGIWGGPKRRIYGLFGCGAAGCFLLTMIGLRPTLVLYGATLLVFMSLMPVVNASSQAIWQRKVPLDMQGRAFAVRRMIAWFMAPIAFGIAGPLADKVFEPALRQGGALVPLLGPAFGVGPGSGMRLLFVLMGTISGLAAVLWLLNPRVRYVESELPDAMNDSTPVAPAVTDRPAASVMDAVEDLEGAFLEP
jgi:DHA3 family macrolide efflux protein-like MFS transporter